MAAGTRAAADVSLGLLAALLQLEDIGRYSCSLSNIGERLLLTGNSAEAQKEHDTFIVGGAQSAGYFFTVTGGVSGYLYVISGCKFVWTTIASEMRCCGERL